MEGDAGERVGVGEGGEREPARILLFFEFRPQKPAARVLSNLIQSARAGNEVRVVSKLPTGTPKKVCSRGRKTQKESVNQYCRCCKLSLRYGDTWKSLSSKMISTFSV